MKSLALCLLVLVSAACHAQSSPQERKDVKSEFLTTYTGTFTEGQFGETWVIKQDGSVANLQYRQVGRNETPAVPYPTVCSYWSIGKITSAIERSAEDRKRYMSYATHEIEVTYDVIALNALDKETVNNPNCKNFRDQEMKIAQGRGLNYSIYSELLSANSFRTHTSGGGDYVEGKPRTESTLDEIFVRAEDKKN